MGASERYSFSLTTFSPSGKLVQIEYALQAVSSGAPSVGIKAVNGCVLATEKKNKSILFEDHSTYKIEQITGNIGMVYSGALVMQEYTQSGGVRPFGVSLLICGWDEPGKTFLEKRYSEDLELEDAVHTAILTLKEGFEGQMTEDNIEIGICNSDGFRRLTPQEVKDYLANIQ